MGRHLGIVLGALLCAGWMEMGPGRASGQANQVTPNDHITPNLQITPPPPPGQGLPPSTPPPNQQMTPQPMPTPVPVDMIHVPVGTYAPGGPAYNPPDASPNIQDPRHFGHRRSGQQDPPATMPSPDPAMSDSSESGQTRIVSRRTRPDEVSGEKPWICWWETNRDAVLATIGRQRGWGAGMETLPEGMRSKVVAALVEGTKSESPGLRAVSAISLGQIGETAELDRVAGMATGDREWYVRGMAWVGVGLMGDAKAEKALLAAKPQSDFEELGVLTGVGLLKSPSAAAFEYLRKEATTARKGEVVRTAVWALRVHHRREDHDLFLQAALQGPGSLPLASEGLLGLGMIGDAGDAMQLGYTAAGGRGQLQDVARFSAAVMAFPATTAYGHSAPGMMGTGAIMRGGQVVGGMPAELTGVSAGHRAAWMGPAPTGQRLGAPGLMGGEAAASNGGLYDEPIQGSVGLIQSDTGAKGILRTSAALALGMGDRGMVGGNPILQNALLQNVYPFLDQYGPYYSGASIMTYAAGAGPQDMWAVSDILEMNTDATVAVVLPTSPARGYAALALGMYLARGGSAAVTPRPILTGTMVGTDRTVADSYVDLNVILAQRYMNRGEPEELRAACVLALGLSGNPANVRRILDGAETVGRDQELLRGYAILALGMLRSTAALNAAGPMLAGSATRIDVDDVTARGIGQLTGSPEIPQDGPAAEKILARRAALLGVGLLGDRRAAAMLAGAWAKDRCTVQDVGRAMSYCHDAAAAEPLARIVSEGHGGAIEAAVTLGWLLDPERPSRLSRLVVGNNYHQYQNDYLPPQLPRTSESIVRNFMRVGDFYLYSSDFGGHVLRGATTRPIP